MYVHYFWLVFLSLCLSQVSLPQVDKDAFHSSALDDSLSLLDTAVEPPVQAANKLTKAGTPPIQGVAQLAGHSVESRSSSGSKWDQLKLPPLEFTDEGPAIDKSDSSTDSELEFHNPARVRSIALLCMTAWDAWVEIGHCMNSLKI